MNKKTVNFNFEDNLHDFQTNHGEDHAENGVLVLENCDDVVKNVWHEVEPAEAYTIETRIKICSHGRENGMKLERGHMRLFVYFYKESFKCVGADCAHTVKLDNPDDFNVLKFRVVQKIAYVYVNGDLKLIYPLGTFRSDSNLLTFFLRAKGNTPSKMEIDYVKYTPEEPEISVISPDEESSFKYGEEIVLKAKIDDSSVPYVDFLASGIPVGRASAEDPSFTFKSPGIGNYYITAKYGDTESLGRWINVTDINGSEAAATVTDKEEYLFGEPVHLSIDSAASDIKEVQYRINGIPSEDTFRASCVGKNTVDAKLIFNDGSYAYTNETTFTVTAGASDSVTPNGNMILKYTAVSGSEVLASDGIFELSVKHSNGSVSYLTADGEAVYSLPDGAYRLHIDSGVCDAYFNEQFAFSFRMPLTDKPAGLTSKLANDLTVSGYNAVRFIDKPCTLADFSLEYALEFTLDSPRDFSVNLKDTAYFIELSAKDGTLTAKTYPNGEAGVIEDTVLCTLPEGRHQYRIPTANGIAQLFIDNIWVSSMRLPVSSGGAAVDFDGLDSVCIRDTNDLYVFEDSFDGKAELPSKAYYSTANGVKAEFSDGAMTLSPSDCESPNEYITYLKAYANHPYLSAKLCIDSAEGGEIYLTARYINEYRNVRAGYNFDEKCWQIAYTNNQICKCLVSVPGEFPFGKETELSLKLYKKAASLLVNGKTVAETDELALPYYGVVGIIARDVIAKVTGISYKGTGRPIPNTVTFLNEVTTPEIFEFAPGNIYCISHPGNMRESTDDGFTFNKVNRPGYFCNTIRLASGTIVSSHREAVGEGFIDYALVSKDNGNTFEGPYPIQDYVINRITMNNKMTQASDGRLFLASGESGDGVEGEGGIRVFYSDDEGVTWKGSSVRLFDGTVVGGKNEARMDVYNTSVNCQESKIAEMPDGTLRLYVRTDEGFLYYSVSTDRGETWSAEMFTTPFITVLSAYNIELDPYTGDYYMAWEYNIKNDHKTIQYPRNRVALAVSRDKMRTWEYVADIDEVADNPYDFGHMNIGLKPTATAVYVDAVKYNPNGKGGIFHNNYMVRVAKENMKSTARFTRPHVLSVKAIDIIEAEILKNIMLLSKDGKHAVAGARIFEFADGTAGYIPLTATAKHIGAVLFEDSSSATLKLGDFEAVFTVGCACAKINGNDVNISAPAKLTRAGISVPVTAISEIFARKVSTASDGTIVTLFDRLDAANIDKIAKNLSV